MRSFGVAPKKRTGPAGKSVGNVGPPFAGGSPALLLCVLNVSLSTKSNDGRLTLARVRPRDPYNFHLKTIIIKTN